MGSSGSASGARRSPMFADGGEVHDLVAEFRTSHPSHVRMMVQLSTNVHAHSLNRAFIALVILLQLEPSSQFGVEITDKARGLQNEAIAAANEVNGIALSGLSEDERRVFIRTMSRVIGALQR